jgi:hypothetical protein
MRGYAAHLILEPTGDFYFDESGDYLSDGDSKFFGQHNLNYPATVGNGFLIRRCRLAHTTPEAAECNGGYELRGDGKWRKHQCAL